VNKEEGGKEALIKGKQNNIVRRKTIKDWTIDREKETSCEKF